MKIRTITTGINLRSLRDINKINEAAQFNKQAQTIFEKNGYIVQSTRISTNPWEDYMGGLSEKEIVSEIKNIEKTCLGLGVSFFNIGYSNAYDKILIISQIIKETSIIFCTAKLGDLKTGINYKNARAAAKVIKQISEGTKNGYGNFRFCAWANCKSGIPFFPASFHLEKEPYFAIALESGDLAIKAFSKSKNLIEAENNLKEVIENEFSKIENIAKKISHKLKIKYRGIDASLAPSLNKDGSIAFAYEKLGFGKFGCNGTLTISAIITKVLKNLSVKTCGFSGLMLPVCEDYGLAERASDDTYSLTNLLLYSSVCGLGLDLVPVPGDIKVENIEAILLDVVTLAIYKNKPLTARILPVPGKAAGKKADFNSPHLIDCKIFRV